MKTVQKHAAEITGRLVYVHMSREVQTQVHIAQKRNERAAICDLINGSNRGPILDRRVLCRQLGRRWRKEESIVSSEDVWSVLERFKQDIYLGDR